MIPPFDKMRTSPFDAVTVDGVHITSRYFNADEFDLMVRVVGGLPPDMRRMMKSLWCDSKATHTYTVELREGCDTIGFARQVGAGLDRLFKQHARGHNGIFIGFYAVDPDWGDAECAG